jgi:hypothetical protein
MLGCGMTFRPEISDIFAPAMDGRFKTSLAQKCSGADGFGTERYFAAQH